MKIDFLKPVIGVFSGIGIRVIAQALFFVLLARKFGSHDYGVISGLIALNLLLSPLVIFGKGHLLIKYAEDHNSFNKYLAIGFGTILSLSLPITVFSYILSVFIYPNNNSSTILLIAISDLVIINFVYLLMYGLQANNFIVKASYIFTLINISKLTWLMLFLAKEKEGLDSFSLYYFLSAISTLIITFLITKKNIPYIKLRILTPNRIQMKESFGFFLSLISTNIYSENDKTILGIFSSPIEIGIYNAAFRIYDALLNPVRAIVFASYRNFIRFKCIEKDRSLKLIKELLVIGIIISTVLTMILAFNTEAIISILGKDFKDLSIVLFALAPLIVLRTVTYILADGITGLGKQKERGYIQLVITGFNVILNIILIPQLGWIGCIMSIYLTEFLFLITYLYVILVKNK